MVRSKTEMLTSGHRDSTGCQPQAISLEPAHFRKEKPALSLLRYSERRKYCPVIDFELLIYVMQVHFDRTLGNAQPARNFFVRQSFGHPTHDLAFAVR